MYWLIALRVMNFRLAFAEKLVDALWVVIPRNWKGFVAASHALGSLTAALRHGRP